MTRSTSAIALILSTSAILAACMPDEEITDSDEQALVDADEDPGIAAVADSAAVAGKTPRPTKPPKLDAARSIGATAVFSCGAAVPPGHWGMCGTLWFGETSIVISNPNPTFAWVWVQYLNDWVGIYPYDSYRLYRWFWGADQYAYNWPGNSGSIVVSH